MKKQFSWYPFGIEFLKSVVYSEKTPKSMRPKFDFDVKEPLIPYMDDICRYPDVHFLKRYRNEIIENFLANSPHLVTVVRALERLNYRGVKAGSMDSMRDQIRRLNMTDTVSRLIIGELYREGDKRIDDDAEFSVFTAPKTIDLERCIPGDIPLYDYQEKAVEALDKCFFADDRSGGILVMPTGSGKTRVAVRFLIESAVAKGWQVLWLTHRAMLIEQTASAVYAHAGALLKSADPGRKRFKMVCVSGSHASVKATERDDDVLICGVQSLVRNLPYLQSVLGAKVMVVIDEAHHAVAPSYRLIINEVKKNAANVKLLGLTATPVRMSDEGTAKLMGMFSGNIVYSVAMSDLIAKAYLAEPKFEFVDTNVDFASELTPPERRYIEKWGELSPETMERLARIKERNMLIADTYMKDRERYGKTLIFALNSTHCISLCEELTSRGVRCDYIYCAHEGNAEKIDRFKKGELDVLVNIQVLTEGSDIPDIQTVFLTRPTQSDVLLMQMIGRGMRGKYAGGTESVNIVCFNDIWDRYVNWLNPQFLIEDELCGEDEERNTSKAHTADETVPWALIRAYMDAIRTEYADQNRPAPVCALPVGWYDVFDEDNAERKVLVFSSQLSGYNAMLSHRASTLDDPDYTGNDAIDDWFGGFGLLPSASDIQMIIDTYRISGEFPHLCRFKERKQADASAAAEKLREENVGIADIDGRLREIYDSNPEVIDSVYGGFDEYCRRVRELLMYPNGTKIPGMKIEEIEEDSITLDRTPVYDLSELTAQVVAEMFDGAYGDLPPVRWSDKAYASYYGEYFYGEHNRIHINRILNSKDVPAETVKYVIYHELLHRDNRCHNKAFRAEEHKFPNWTEHERFLDNTFPKFDRELGM